MRMAMLENQAQRRKAIEANCRRLPAGRSLAGKAVLGEGLRQLGRTEVRVRLSA